MENHFGRFEESIFYSLILINIFVFMIFLTGMAGIGISPLVVIFEAGMLLGFKSKEVITDGTYKW